MPRIVMPTPDAPTLAARDRILSELGALCDEGTLVGDGAGRKAFETDALTAYRARPLAVVLPKSTQEVSRILKYCHAHNLKVVARGAGTSLSGGALPLEDAVVIGLSRMNKLVNLNVMDRIATVEAGMTNIAISQAAAEAKLFYAPDPSSQLACTIGGNVAMNSGGAHCLKYGVTTNNVLGLKVVLMDGEIVEVGGDFPDPVGYDMLGLLVGSEGQFGIVTEVTVRLLPQAEGARPMLLGFASAEAAGDCVAAIIGHGLIPVAIEFMDKPAIEVCEKFAGAGYPMNVEALLIVEVEGSAREIEDQLARIEAIAQPFLPKTVRISQSEAESAAIWKGRKAAFGALGRISDYFCMDGVIPLAKLGPVLEQVREIGDRYGLKVANIFHAGDGNLHPLILYDANDASEREKAEACGADILKLCVDVGGCLTGEHGVGIEKRELMTYQYTEADLRQQMRIKGAFDPKWLLNDGKVFPLALQQRFKKDAAAHG